MLRGADGELVRDESNNYLYTTLNKHQFNGRHWNSFLNVIYQKIAKELEDKYKTKILDLDNYGGNLTLLHPVSSVSSACDGFDYFYQENKEHWSVIQDKDGIDTEDRILLAIKQIKAIVQRHIEKLNASDIS